MTPEIQSILARFLFAHVLVDTAMKCIALICADEAPLFFKHPQSKEGVAWLIIWWLIPMAGTGWCLYLIGKWFLSLPEFDENKD